MRCTPWAANTGLRKLLKRHLSRWKILLTLESIHPSLGLNWPRCCGHLPDLFTYASLKNGNAEISQLPSDMVKKHMELEIKARILHPPLLPCSFCNRTDKWDWLGRVSCGHKLKSRECFKGTGWRIQGYIGNWMLRK